MNRSQLEEVVRKLHREAYLWARQCCNFQDWLAEDVVQEVYLKILTEKAKFNEQSSVKTWLFSVIRFTANEHLKKDTSVFPVDRSEENIEDKGEDAQINYEKLILKLPEKQREILLLVFYHGLTIEKSAAVMGISLGTARTHYDRGKKNLKVLILKKKEHEGAG